MSITSLDLKFEVGGFREVMEAIRATEPKIRAKMDKEIRSALRDVQRDAKEEYGDGSWVVRINKRGLFGLIETAPGSLNKKDWGASDPGAKSSLYEFIGAKYSGNRPQVVGLIESLNDRFGNVSSGGRVLWDAWDKNATTVLARIRTAVLAAEKEFQAAMDSAGEVY